MTYENQHGELGRGVRKTLPASEGGRYKGEPGRRVVVPFKHDAHLRFDGAGAAAPAYFDDLAIFDQHGNGEGGLR